LLKSSAYEVKTSVAPGVFSSFVDALGGKQIDITDANVASLLALSHEFGFRHLLVRCLASVTRTGASMNPSLLATLYHPTNHVFGGCHPQSSITEQMTRDHLAEVRVDLQFFKSNVESVRHCFGELKTDLTNLRSDFVRLNSCADKSVADIEGLKTNLATLSGEVKTGFNKSVADIEGLKTNLATLRGQADGLRQSHDDLNRRHRDLCNSVRPFKGGYIFTRRPS
jgi:hypothetical protein